MTIGVMMTLLLAVVGVLGRGARIGRADPPPAATTQPAPTSAPTAPQVTTSQPTTQEAAPPKTASPEAIKAAIQRTEAATDLDDTAKQKILGVLNQALADLRLIEQWRADRAKFQALAVAAPDQLAAAKAETEKLGGEAPVAFPEDESITQLEQRLKQEEAALADARRDSDAADERIRTRALRRLELPRLQADADSQLQELLKAIASSSPPESNAQVLAARREQRMVPKAALEEQKETLAAEQTAVEAVDELYAVQSELARTKRVQREARVEALREELTKRRKAEAEIARQRAEAEAAEAVYAHPAVKAVADEVVALAAKRQQILGMTEGTERRRTAIEAKLPELEPRLREARETVQNFGLTQAIGYLLRKQQRELDSIPALKRELSTTERDIADAHFEATVLGEQRSVLSDLDQATGELLSAVTEQPRGSQRAWIERLLHEKLSAKRDALGDLIKDYSAFISAKGRLYTQQKKLLDVTEKFSEFIDEHVLWVRSEPPLALRDFGAAVTAFSFFTDEQAWTRLGNRIVSDVRRLPVEASGIGAALALAFVLRWRMKRAIAGIGDQLLRERFTSFAPTLQAVFLTLLISVFWPAIIVLVSMWLTQPVDATVFEKSLSAGLFRVGAIVVATEVFRLICSRNGLAEAHFGWARDTTWQFRRDLSIVLVLATPVVVISRAIFEGASDSARASLGRIAFIAGVCVFSYLMHHLVRPRQGTFAVMFALRPGGVFDRLRYITYLAAMGIMLGLVALAVTGYQYSALRIAWCVQASIWLLLGLATVYALILRWLVLAHRRLALKQAAEQANSDSNAPAAEAIAQEEQVSLSAISHQTQRLVRSAGFVVLLLALWGIWGDVLPAFEMLRGVPLWSNVTLVDLLLAVSAALLTFIASKNIPGLLEILILRNLSIDHGLRYAVTTITRYVIFVIGLAIAFDFVGLNWGNVQWLVAAMTVGLGFGLQEIFANFVSGIIVLFERPVRVGDLVTVGGVTGIVTQIRTRATTIRDGDCKELIVPNREFVTGQIVNWTLSDEVVRMTFTIGVAYGTDTRRVRNLLLRIAKENPRVLADPEPLAVFEEFGDSTLNFALRVYVGKPAEILNVRHQINTAINDVFAEEHIEIAFPQRDVRVHFDLPSGKQDPAEAIANAVAGAAPRESGESRPRPAAAPVRK